MRDLQRAAEYLSRSPLELEMPSAWWSGWPPRVCSDPRLGRSPGSWPGEKSMHVVLREERGGMQNWSNYGEGKPKGGCAKRV